MISVEIDPDSGFCGGVIRAISTAERYLESRGAPLYSLGEIVHNEQELARLEALGLKTVSSVEQASGAPLLIRAHGEPPKVYGQAESLSCEILDCTCPVVLRLQRSICEAYLRLAVSGGSIVIYGKEGHPEVLGLVGQVDGKVIVAPSEQRLRKLVETGELALNKDIELFSQTTMSPEGYERVAEYLRERVQGTELRVHRTICSQVAMRHKRLSEFASRHDVIIFVAGRQSSNGKVLSELCLRQNARTYMVGSEEELRSDWLGDGDSVGVCGATSTPRWLLEKVAEGIKNLL